MSTRKQSGHKALWLAGLALVVGALGGCGTRDTAKTANNQQNVHKPVAESYPSGGRNIPVEWFAAVGVGTHKPAVLILHGSEGFTMGGDDYYRAAQQLSAAGYQAFVVHYFARTGDSFVLRRSTIKERLPAWESTVRDGIAYVATHQGVDRDRIGLLGASLGGGLSVLAGRNNPAIKVIIDYFGFYPDQLSSTDRLPPVLMLHGSDDTILPVEKNSQKLKAFLDRNSVPNELVVYPGATHGFRGPQGAQVKQNAAQRAETFLGRYLNNP